MKKAKLILSLAAVGLLFSCGGGAGDGISSALFGNRVLQPQQTCTVTVNTVDALRSALTAAQSNNQNDVICIEAGTYTVDLPLIYRTPNGDGGKTLTIKAVGGQVVLDGNNRTQIMEIKTYSPGYGVDPGAHVTIEGITFRGGRIGSGSRGGGLEIVTHTANITLTNNTFTNNSADNGGGVWASSQSGIINVTANIFSNNRADSSGGGVHLNSLSGTIILTNNIFRNNNANMAGGAYVHSSEGTITVTNNTFSNNSVVYRGGGAIVGSGSGTITLANNTFSNNSANQSGGGVEVRPSTTTLVINNIFSNNSAGGTNGRGGGVYALISTITINETLSLINNTFYNNNASRMGGGAYIGSSGDQATGDIYNNIFWQNTANAGENDGDDLYVESDLDRNQTPSLITVYNNSFSGVSTFYITMVQAGRVNIGGNIQADPLFVNANARNFRLQAGSPCINAGNNNAPGLPQTDKDGNPRIVGGTVDMGAYEFHGAVTIYTLTVNKQGTGSGTVTSDPQGINCGQTCSVSFPVNTQVTLEATPDQGSVFAGWGGDCARCGTDTQCPITMNANRTCTATFNTSGPATHTLQITRAGDGRADSGVTISASGGGCNISMSGQGSDTASCSVNSGSNVTISVSVPAKYAIKWGGDCSTTTGTSCTLNSITANKNVTVEVYKPKQVTVNRTGNAASSASVSANVTKGPNFVVPVEGTCTLNFSNGSASCSVPHGSTLKLTPSASGDVTFSWNGCDQVLTSPPPPQCVIESVTNNRTVTLTVTATGGGGGGPPTDTGSTQSPAGGQIQVTVEGGTFTAQPTIVTNIPAPPEGGTAPHGGVTFTVQLAQGQNSITVRVTFPNIPQGARFFKLIGNQYIDITGQVQVSGNTITLTVVDNSPLDASPQSGTISDPIVLVVPQQQGGQQPPAQQGGGGGGGCSMGSSASPLNGLLWLLPPLMVLARRVRKAA